MTVVGTWNLENLFRPGGEFGPDDEARFRVKVQGIAEVVASSGVDVLGVQEVGNPDALSEVADLLGPEWQIATSRHFQSEHAIRVGFLSRLPVEVVRDTAAFPAELGAVRIGDDGTTTNAMGRGALAVRLTEASGQELTVVSCHLKSKLLSFPGPDGRKRFSPTDEGQRARVAAYALNRRAAEAVTVRALADELLDDQGLSRQLMVLGDLNDEPHAATTQILLGPPGSELGTFGADRPDKGDASRLWNLAPRLAAGEAFTRVFRGRGELIDHILVSHALLARTREVHTVDPKRLPSVEGDPAARRNAPSSDHAMVLTRLA